MSRHTRDHIRAALARPSLGASTDEDLVALRAAAPRPMRPAAVLCPLIARPGGLHVILTRRAEGLAHHPGQVAFPGGKVDPTDAGPLAAALREAEEEIGLPPALVEVAGTLDRHQTITGYEITPFVGFVDARFTPRLDTFEVAELFEVPFDFLMDPANHRTGERDGPFGRRAFHEMPWNGYHIWGATARILRGLALRLAEPAAACG